MTQLPIIEKASSSPVAGLTDASDPKGTYAFVSLGCPKNLVDSERMLGILASQGYVPVSAPVGADMVIVNTCAFIESSRQESRAVIDEMTQLKQRGDVKGVIVTGCLAERMGPQIITEIPLVDHAVGVFGREEIAKVADRFMNGAAEQRTVFKPAAIRALPDTARLRVTPAHYAYLKISEGCDRTCTFCAIPKMRGKHVTKPIEQIVEEARELAQDGVRELILVSQDSTYYGKDLYGQIRLADLARELNSVDGIEWIRLLYAYPEHIDEDLVETLANCEKIVPYLDMPLQHISDKVLKRMQRRHTKKRTIEILDLLRDRWPNLAMRTTFIVGFPGETDKQFEELLSFVREARFERAGVFAYSPEEGTPAMKLDGHLPEDIKEDRRAQLMEAQQQIAFEHAQQKIGREIVLLVDEIDPDEENSWIARSPSDAPDIDTVTFVTAENLSPGQFTHAKVLDSLDYDLVAEATGEPW